MSSLTLTTNNQASVYIHKPLSSTSNVVVQPSPSLNSTTSSSNINSVQLQHLSTSNVASKPPTNSITQPATKFYTSLGNTKTSIPKSASASDGRLTGPYLPSSHGGTTTTNLPTAGSQRTSLNSNRSNLTMNRHSASFTRTPSSVAVGSTSNNAPSKLQTQAGAEHVLYAQQQKSSQQPQLHSQNSGPVPDTLLNSAFIFPNNHVRRNSLQNSPLLSQPSSLNSSAMIENETTDAMHTPPTSTVAVTGTATRHSFNSFTPGGSKIPPSFERSSSEGEPDYMRRLEEENALMCEELQATVVELSEARELVRQMGLLKDQGEARLQSILHCMYEQNTVLDQCCGQMDFLRALVDESGPQKMERKSKSVDAFEDTHPTSTSSAILDGSTDEEADTEKTPEEVSASCVRKLNRLEVLLKHKLKEDRAIRIDMKKTKQSLSDQKMENEMLRIRLESLQQKRNSEQFDAPSSLNLTNSSTTRNFSESDASSTASSPTVASHAKVLETLSKQYEEMLRNKEVEISKLRDDLQRANRSNNAIDSMRRLQPAQAAKEEMLTLQERLDKVTKEKEEVMSAKDDLSKDIIKVRAELTIKMEQLSVELRQMESERDEWRGRFGEVEKEIQYVKEITEEKMEDMAVALVVAHDFQVEESQRKQEVEKDLENAKAQLAQLESEFRIQRSESESMKRNLETEREAHRVELDREKKHAEELSSNVCQLKKQLGDSTNKQNEFKSSPLTLSNRETTSNKPPITTPTPTTPSREKPPKIIRMSSLNEPPSPQMSLKTPIDVDADVDDDCVDNAPIIKNVRSMVENFESPNSGSGGGSGGGSSAPKQRRYSGAKRRTFLPSSQSLDERLCEAAGDCNNGSGGLDVGSGDVCATAESSQQSIINKVSSAIKSINEKCEAMEQNSCVGLSGGASTSSSANATTPKIGSGHPKRPLRSQTSAFELSTKVPYRSPLNKLKINDIVVQRNSIAPRQKVSDPMLKQNAATAGSSSSTASSDSENVQPGGPGGAVGDSATTMAPVSTITTTVISSPVQKSATPSTHVITTTLPPLASVPSNNTSACSSPLVTFTTTTPADLSAPVVAPPPTENRAVKELMQKGSHVSVRNALLEWCKNVTRNFPGVEVTNFSSSWSDGLAFCALFYSSASSTLLKQCPAFSQLVRLSSKAENFAVAQKLAKLMGVKFDLDVESIMKAERPDWKVILPVIRTIFEDISSLDTAACSPSPMTIAPQA